MFVFALRIDGHDHGLRTEFPREFGNQLRAVDGSRIHRDFVRPGLNHGARFLSGEDSAAGRERNREFCRDAPDGVEERRTAISRSPDVEHDQLIGAFTVVTSGEFGGIAGVAKTGEIYAFHYAAAVGIEARNDASGESHAASLTKLRRSCAPAAPLFSGWNCTPKRLPRSMAATNSQP